MTTILISYKVNHKISGFSISKEEKKIKNLPKYFKSTTIRILLSIKHYSFEICYKSPGKKYTLCR